MMKKRIAPSEAAAALGSIKTAKKAASSAANGCRRGLLPLDSFACLCHRCPDEPRTYCPRGRAILRRRGNAELGSEAATISQAKSFAKLAAGKREKLHALMSASQSEREAALKASAPRAAAFYATPEGAKELDDWRALQDEPFHD